MRISTLTTILAVALLAFAANVNSKSIRKDSSPIDKVASVDSPNEIEVDPIDTIDDDSKESNDGDTIEVGNDSNNNSGWSDEGSGFADTTEVPETTLATEEPESTPAPEEPETTEAPESSETTNLPDDQQLQEVEIEELHRSNEDIILNVE